MADMGIGKTERILTLYTKFLNGDLVNKQAEAKNFGVDERTLQRDIDSIRNFFERETADSGFINEIKYDRKRRGFYLEHVNQLTNSEVLSICKILLDSRAFIKEEMDSMLDRLISCCVSKDEQKQVKKLIENEAHHYVELQHKTRFMDKIWEIGQAISTSRYIEIKYRKPDKEVVTRKLVPNAIMFSEYYFYLTAFIEDEKIRENFDVENDIFPTIYRIDRILKLKVLDERCSRDKYYKGPAQEGEFRKRIQFMTGGRLQKLKFKFKGTDIEPILDKLPTAKILSKEEDGAYIIYAEVFGNGIERWLRSQGDLVEVIECK